MIKKLCLVVLSFFAFSLVAYAGSKNVYKKERVDYIVKLAPGADVKKLSKVFAPYEISDVKNLGKDLVRINFKKDPGFKKVKELAKKSASLKIVEPDYKIKISTPMEQEATDEKGQQ